MCEPQKKILYKNTKEQFNFEGVAMEKPQEGYFKLNSDAAVRITELEVLRVWVVTSQYSLRLGLSNS